MAGGIELRRTTPRAVEKLVWGLALVGLGILLLLEQWDLIGVGGLHRLWPVFVLAAGVGRLFSPRRRGGGVVLVGLALIFLAANHTAVGWRQIWPLFLVLGGVHVLMKGLQGDSRRPSPRGDRQEWGR